MKIQTNINNLKNYRIYLQVEKAVNEFLEKNNYLKVELPVLSPALIPESYLEVFETEFKYFEKKEKLYLTQSPEIFLKRLLIAGIGNCYYLGRAFRNSEPNSSWHSPEFTILEFYKIGVNYLELADEVLKLLRHIDNKVKSQNSKVTLVPEQSSVQGALNRSSIWFMGKNSSQKLKFDRWEKYSVAEAFEKYSNISEKELFDEKLFIKKAKSKGYNTKAASYEDLFSQIIAAEIEPKLGISGRPTLLYDYPRQLASLAKLSQDGRTAERCEFYINGLEIGGFCTELNNYQEQQKRFISESKKRKQNKMINHTIDKGFIKALKYDLPFCTGAGIGFERLVMIFANVTSIDQLKLINIS